MYNELLEFQKIEKTWLRDSPRHDRLIQILDESKDIRITVAIPSRHNPNAPIFNYIEKCNYKHLLDISVYIYKDDYEKYKYLESRGYKLVVAKKDVSLVNKRNKIIKDHKDKNCIFVLDDDTKFSVRVPWDKPGNKGTHSERQTTIYIALKYWYYMIKNNFRDVPYTGIAYGMTGRSDEKEYSINSGMAFSAYHINPKFLYNNEVEYDEMYAHDFDLQLNLMLNYDCDFVLFNCLAFTGSQLGGNVEDINIEYRREGHQRLYDKYSDIENDKIKIVTMNKKQCGHDITEVRYRNKRR
jgi:hypothetical protein